MPSIEAGRGFSSSSDASSSFLITSCNKSHTIWHGIRAWSIIFDLLLTHLPIIGSLFMIFWDHLLQPDYIWSSLIISDQAWPTIDHHLLLSCHSPSWSPGIIHIYGDFLRIYESSEVGHNSIFAVRQFGPYLFISAVPKYWFGLVLTETTSNSCGNLLCTHPLPQICQQIICWDPRTVLHTDDQVVVYHRACVSAPFADFHLDRPVLWIFIQFHPSLGCW